MKNANTFYQNKLNAATIALESLATCPNPLYRREMQSFYQKQIDFAEKELAKIAGMGDNVVVLER
jgi:hypothetical protein